MLDMHCVPSMLAMDAQDRPIANTQLLGDLQSGGAAGSGSIKLHQSHLVPWLVR
jgi:hypothetical protein